MENSIYTVDYFIKKFEAIPEGMIIKGDQGQLEDYGNYPHCGIGWCKNERGDYGDSSATNSLEARALAKLFLTIGITSWSTSEDGMEDSGWNVANVNNGDDQRYQQPTPKQRILAALYDIKAKQQPAPKAPEPKERIVYVMVDSTVKELSGQLTNN